MSPSAPGRRREGTTEVLANESRGARRNGVGRKGSRGVIELLDKGAIGARRRGVPCDAAGGGRGIEVTVRRAIQEILVVGFAILLL
jgi:hypothetical protein